MKDKIKQFEEEFVYRSPSGVPEWNLKYKDKSQDFIILSVEQRIKDSYLNGWLDACEEINSRKKDPTEEHLLKVLKKAQKIKDKRYDQKTKDKK